MLAATGAAKVDDLIGHDPIALRWIENALARTGPADPAFDPGCNVSGA